MSIATQEVFAHTDEATEVWYTATPTPKQTLLQEGDRVAITLTDTEGVTSSKLIDALHTITGITKPGASLRKADSGPVGHYAVGVATDGTWEFTGITGALLTTPRGTVVYVEPDGDLTLTESTNVRVGVVNYPATYTKAAGKLPVKIGA